MRRVREDVQTARKNTRLIEMVQTADATPTVGYSISLGETRQSFGTFRITAVLPDRSMMSTFKVEAGFRRATGGNVTRIAFPQIATQTDWTGGVSTRPSVDVVANTGTQSIDVTLTGKAATTINWYIEIESVQNLT